MESAGPRALPKTYGDCSTRHGLSAAVFYRSPRDYGAHIFANDDSFLGELKALHLAALRAPIGSRVLTDHSGLVALAIAPTCAPRTPRTNLALPDLSALRTTIQERALIVSHCPGHGHHAPAPMAFVDILSRYLVRHVAELELSPGDDLVAGGRLPVLDTRGGLRRALLHQVLNSLDPTFTARRSAEYNERAATRAAKRVGAL